MVNVAPRPSHEADVEPSAVRLYDGSRHRQPETRAGHPVVEAHARLEDSALLGGRNARALIRDRDPNHVAASDRGDDDTGSVAVRDAFARRLSSTCRSRDGSAWTRGISAAISLSTTAPPSRAAATASATSVERSTASSRTETTPSATIRSIPRQAATARRTRSALAWRSRFGCPTVSAIAESAATGLRTSWTSMAKRSEPRSSGMTARRQSPERPGRSLGHDRIFRRDVRLDARPELRSRGVAGRDERVAA